MVISRHNASFFVRSESLGAKTFVTHMAQPVYLHVSAKVWEKTIGPRWVAVWVLLPDCSFSCLAD